MTDPTAPLLSATGIKRHFGGVHAVDGMDIEVRTGELVGLIGPNGAGKSTFFDCLSGFQTKDAGTVQFEGHDISSARRYRIARRGLVRTFQSTSALERMTVLDNLRVAAQGQTGERLLGALRARTWRDEEATVEAEAHERLAFFGIDHQAELLAGDLSGGQKKLLDLARALMAKPRMMLLDEPLAGVNPSLRRTIMDRIQDLRQEGMTFLLIEHDMASVFGHCDRVVVMADGRLLAQGTPREVQNDPAVREAYLGT